MGAGLIAVIPGDVSLVDADEVEEGLNLAPCSSVTVVIPDRRRPGTNGLMFATSAPPEFTYGADSFAKYLEQNASRRTMPLSSRSLELDVDEPREPRLHSI